MASSLGWAAYLACSWTWCIGMYLPLVLRDHYGWSAVLAFAIPNIAGVMLFGAAVGTAAMGRSLIARHERAMLWFSLTTIAFHVYFLGAVWRYEFADAWWAGAMLVPLPIVALAWLMRGLSDRLLVRAGVGVYALSVALMVVTAAGFWPQQAEQARQAVWEARSPAGVVFLTPILFLGFLLCPYLDLTFHRALLAERGGRAGRRTFVLFGALFTVMLIFTAVYSQTGFAWPVIVHILIQSWFTMTLHFKELEARRGTVAGEAMMRRTWPVLVVSWALAPLPLVDYRWWFVFTGLIFPAYVALMMVRPRLGRPGVHGAVLAIVTLLLMPFVAFGFLGGNAEWLVLVPCAALALSLWIGAPAPAPAMQRTASDETAPDRLPLPTG